MYSSVMGKMGKAGCLQAAANNCVYPFVHLRMAVLLLGSTPLLHMDSVWSSAVFLH